MTSTVMGRLLKARSTEDFASSLLRRSSVGVSNTLIGGPKNQPRTFRIYNFFNHWPIAKVCRWHRQWDNLQ